MWMRRLAAVAVIALLGVAAAAFLFPDRVRPFLPQAVARLLPADEEEARRDGGRAAPVELTTAAAGLALETFETSGEVIAEESVRLAAETSGRVAEIFVEDGARLKEGDRVLSFDARAERADVAAAEAQLGEALAELGRAETLYEENVVAEARVETARAQAQSARGALEAAEARLRDQIVQAPFDGEIGFIAPDQGAYLNAGDEIAEFARVTAPRIRFDLPIEIADQAREVGEIRVKGREDACATAEVVTVSPVNDPATRTRTFEARPPEPCDLIPGALVVIAVTLDRRKDAVLVPLTAVQREGFRSYVYRAVEGEGDGLVARRTPVTTGAYMGEEVEIREGLQAGDRIVASGLQRLSDGAAITPTGDDDGSGGGASSGGGSGADGSGEDGSASARTNGDGEAESGSGDKVEGGSAPAAGAQGSDGSEDDAGAAQAAVMSGGGADGQNGRGGGEGGR